MIMGKDVLSGDSSILFPMIAKKGNFVRGIAFESRRRMVESEIGKEEFGNYLRWLAERDRFWKQNTIATTLIPLDSFLRFNDGLITRYYHNDTMKYWRWGKAAAKWALTDGPYRNFMKEKDLHAFFLRVLPLIWGLYFTFGSATTERDGRRLRVVFRGLPKKHPYLEYSPMGWVEGAIILKGEGIEEIRAVSVDRHRVVYDFILTGSHKSGM